MGGGKRGERMSLNSEPHNYSDDPRVSGVLLKKRTCQYIVHPSTSSSPRRTELIFITLKLLFMLVWLFLSSRTVQQRGRRREKLFKGDFGFRK